MYIRYFLDNVFGAVVALVVGLGTPLSRFDSRQFASQPS